MTSVRVRTGAAGAAIAVLAGALVDHGEIFGNDFLGTALLGLLAGAVVGLVPHRTAVARVAAFAAGFGAAWLGYLLRAGVLPDIPLGRAIAAVVVVSLVTAVATATADRLPLWAGLAGAATMVGGFEAAFAAAPGDVVAGSTTAATSVLLAAAFGFVVTSLLSAWAPAAGPQHAARAEHAELGEIDNTIVLGGTPAAGTTPVPGPRVSQDVPTTSETHR